MLVSALKKLDQLFLQANQENTLDLWGKYLGHRQDFEETYDLRPISLRFLGVSLEDALDKSPAGQSTQTVRRWVKCLHLIDAPGSIITERYVELTDYIRNPR